jgi:hypothetical protein
VGVDDYRERMEEGKNVKKEKNVKAKEKRKNS